MSDNDKDEPDWLDFHIEDGVVHIADLHEFYAETDAIASKFVSGKLSVLNGKTLQWVDVTDLRKPEPKPTKSGNVSAIK